MVICLRTIKKFRLKLRIIKSKPSFYVQYSFSFPEDGAVYEIMLKNRVEADRSQMTIYYRTCEISCRLTTATHSEYVIIIAYVLQQRLNECASMLRLYVHCLSCLFRRRFRERYVQSVLCDGCYCYFFFFPWRYTTHCGFVFYSPLSGFILIAYEVT